MGSQSFVFVAVSDYPRLLRASKRPHYQAVEREELAGREPVTISVKRGQVLRVADGGRRVWVKEGRAG